MITIRYLKVGEMPRDRLETEYTGKGAENYESKRAGEEKWHREKAALYSTINVIDLASNPKILDIPVGTGRFLSDYKSRGADVVGLDVSEDMLVQAAKTARALEFDGVNLQRGDATQVALPSDSVDLAVCVRLLNWVALDVVHQIISELSRVSQKYVVIGVRSTLPFSDESVRSGFRRALHALKRAVRRTAHPRRLFVVRHSEHHILEIIASIGLIIEHRKLIERRSDGTKYEFWVLRTQQ